MDLARRASREFISIFWQMLPYITKRMVVAAVLYVIASDNAG